VLRTRVATALLLVAIYGWALFASAPWPFTLLTLVLIAAAGWEWGRLNQVSAAWAVAAGMAVAVAGVALLGTAWQAGAPAPFWWLVVALWLAWAVFALRQGPSAWPRVPRAARWVLGVAVLVAAWLALVQARAIGVNFMLSVLCVVWMADVAAYFGGRAFGRRKLAPSISPGKSWEGVWSGIVGVLLLSALWIWLDRRHGFDGPSLYSQLLGHFGVAGMLLVLVAMCGFSVVGDLIESLVKRAAGAKDSSRLLPGHGGVLDRIDALLPVLPLALAVVSIPVRAA
jgi:phosphatidate cytidylyltransferase